MTVRNPDTARVVGAADEADKADKIGRALVDIIGERHVSLAPSAPLQPSGPTPHAAHGDAPSPDDASDAGADDVANDREAPAWRVQPGSAAEVAELVRVAARERICIIPIGNATRAPRLAALADRMCLFVDVRRMNHILHLDETSLLVHAQAGLTALALEQVLVPRRLSLGDYPPSTLGSTLGGLLAVRTPGKVSTRHGFVEDAVLGVSAVLADGRTVHTRVAPRRATGPDLARALCGSEGTLGIITSAVLRIHRAPEARFLSAHALPDLATALAAVNLALREEAAPSALRVYDHAEARRHLGDDVCTGDGQAEGEAVIVAATAGPTDLAACDRDLIASVVQALGGRALPGSVAERWWQRRIGREPATAPAPVLQVAAAPPVQASAHAAVVAAAAALGVRARGHVSRFDGDGAVLFFSFDDARGESLVGEPLARVRAEAERAVSAAGAVPLGGSTPALAPWFAELRRQLDPAGIMNPAALVG